MFGIINVGLSIFIRYQINVVLYHLESGFGFCNKNWLIECTMVAAELPNMQILPLTASAYGGCCSYMGKRLFLRPKLDFETYGIALKTNDELKYLSLLASISSNRISSITMGLSLPFRIKVSRSSNKYIALRKMFMMPRRYV